MSKWEQGQDQNQRQDKSGEAEVLSSWARDFFSTVSEPGESEKPPEGRKAGAKLYGGDYSGQGDPEAGPDAMPPAGTGATPPAGPGNTPRAGTGTMPHAAACAAQETTPEPGGVPEGAERSGSSGRSAATTPPAGTGATPPGRKTPEPEPEKSRRRPGQIRISFLALFLSFAVTILVTVFVTFWAADRFYFGKGAASGSKVVSFDEAGLDEGKTAKFQDILAFIRQYYYTDYDINQLVEGAIGGLVKALGDPYGGYYPPGSMSSYTDFIEGSYTGIGFRSHVCDEGMEVVEVFEDSPADKAGIVAGDKVTHINGKDVPQLSSEELSAMLGSAGTEISLTVLHAGGETETVTLTVEKIITPSVTYKELESDIKYIHISQFIDGTAEEFRAAVSRAASGPCRGLVIDLRNNPGGYEREASAVADIILPEGTVATSRDRNGKLLKTVTSDANELTVPVVLLVNQNTASASELLAGAFRDFEKGALVGVHTYGKALAQINKTYEADGSGIVLTTSRYYTPSGECIDGVGIEPTVPVELPAEYRNTDPLNIPADQDTQLIRAIGIIKDGADS